MTREEFYRRRWEKHILGTYPEMPEHCLRPNLIAYCLAMASHGKDGTGLGCYASDATIGKEIGIANRATVAKYRRLAMDLGWFRWDGARHGRAKDLDISIPADAGIAAKPAEIPTVIRPTVTEHNRATSPALCPACRPLILAGKTPAEVLDIHRGE